MFPRMRILPKAVTLCRDCRRTVVLTQRSQRQVDNSVWLSPLPTVFCTFAVASSANSWPSLPAPQRKQSVIESDRLCLTQQI